jgi:hypothetical protein
VHIWGHEGSVPDINGFHTVTEIVSTTAYKIAVDVTTAGARGVSTEQTWTALDQKCADMLTTIGAHDSDCTTIDGPDCGSLWNLFYAWVSDETRAPQRIAFAAPWHAAYPVSGILHELGKMNAQYDASTPGCYGCGDRYIYKRNLWVIRNIHPDQIADDGCGGKSCGDTGAINLNVLRKTAGGN